MNTPTPKRHDTAPGRAAILELARWTRRHPWPFTLIILGLTSLAYWIDSEIQGAPACLTCAAGCVLVVQLAAWTGALYIRWRYLPALLAALLTLPA
jgi:hypothetical protein